VAIISVTISGNAAPLRNALNDSETALDKFGKVAKVGLAAAATGFVALGTAAGVALKGAIEVESQQNRLRQILKTTGAATDAQVDSLLKQADALEKVGVASASSIVTAQSQLATFDLQFETIQRLTPAIADYVIAEKGATASSEDFKSMTNALAQALQGNFGALTKSGFVLDEVTKELIKNGTEAERSAALVEVLGSTYEGFNEAARETAEGQLVALQNAFGAVKDEIGLALLPVFKNVVDLLQKQMLPAFEKVMDFISGPFAATVSRLGERLIPVLQEAFRDTTSFVRDITVPVFETLRSKVSEVSLVVRDNEDAFRNLKIFMQDLVTFIRDRVAPNFEKILGGSLALVATRDIPKLIDGFLKVAGIVSQVGSFVIKMVDATIDAIEILINGILEGVNFIIRQLNRIPGVNIGEIGSVDFNPSRPSGSTPSLPNFLGSPDRLPSPSLQVPGISGSLGTIGDGTTGGGGGGGGGSRGGGGGGGGGGTTINAGTVNFAAPMIDYAALGRTESAYLADIALGGIPTGLEYLFSDFSESARFADAGLLDTAQNINITVNTVTADENLPTVIVDALQRYNLIYGPAEIEIAI
jgi:hypothetical protein